MVSNFGGWWRHTKHRNHTQMGMVSIFGRLGGCGTSKTCPDGHSFDVRQVDAGRASKACPSGHFFNIRQVARWWTHTEHRKNAVRAWFRCSGWWTDVKHQNHAQMGVVSMFGKWWRRMGVGGGQTAPLRRVSHEGGGTGWLEGMAPPPSRVSSEGGGWGWLEGRESPPSHSKSEGGDRGWLEANGPPRFERARGIGGWKEDNPLRLA